MMLNHVPSYLDTMHVGPSKLFLRIFSMLSDFVYAKNLAASVLSFFHSPQVARNILDDQKVDTLMGSVRKLDASFKNASASMSLWVLCASCSDNDVLRITLLAILSELVLPDEGREGTGMAKEEATLVTVDRLSGTCTSGAYARVFCGAVVLRKENRPDKRVGATLGFEAGFGKVPVSFSSWSLGASLCLESTAKLALFFVFCLLTVLNCMSALSSSAWVSMTGVSIVCLSPGLMSRKGVIAGIAFDQSPLWFWGDFGTFNVGKPCCRTWCACIKASWVGRLGCDWLWLGWWSGMLKPWSGTVQPPSLEPRSAGIEASCSNLSSSSKLISDLTS
jgi:hypothetical protein